MIESINYAYRQLRCVHIPSGWNAYSSNGRFNDSTPTGSYLYICSNITINIGIFRIPYLCTRDSLWRGGQYYTAIESTSNIFFLLFSINSNL